MLGYNRTNTRTNINVLINIGPGAGGGRKRRGKKGNLPNTFDDDCRLAFAICYEMRLCFINLRDKRKKTGICNRRQN